MPQILQAQLLCGAALGDGGSAAEPPAARGAPSWESREKFAENSAATMDSSEEGDALLKPLAGMSASVIADLSCARATASRD
ncbi:hypothetical protein H920_09641 [Fukomys damarensis]|uniref:Uncharacterized protein n=1 Tax=Fukomys damarensis TaxID=885580 RepID=A0A091E1N5_FUKDA|nr:hypothetical protein H920_09641 [Fukomys damarensis]